MENLFFCFCVIARHTSGSELETSGELKNKEGFLKPSRTAVHPYSLLSSVSKRSAWVAGLKRQIEFPVVILLCRASLRVNGCALLVDVPPFGRSWQNRTNQFNRQRIIVAWSLFSPFIRLSCPNCSMIRSCGISYTIYTYNGIIKGLGDGWTGTAVLGTGDARVA